MPLLSPEGQAHPPTNIVYPKGWKDKHKYKINKCISPLSLLVAVNVSLSPFQRHTFIKISWEGIRCKSGIDLCKSREPLLLAFISLYVSFSFHYHCWNKWQILLSTKGNCNQEDELCKGRVIDKGIRCYP